MAHKIHDAARAGDLAKVRSLLEADETQFHYASGRCRLEAVKLLHKKRPARGAGPTFYYLLFKFHALSVYFLELLILVHLPFSCKD